MVAKVTASLTGVKKLDKKLKKYTSRTLEEVAVHLNREAEGIMSQSKELVPVDTGTLRSSGHVKDAVIKGRKVQVQLGYGGAGAEYAKIVHEDLNAFHTVGMAKYLSIPYRKAVKGVAKRISVRLKKLARRL